MIVILFIKQYFQIKITNNLQRVQYNTIGMEHSALQMSYMYIGVHVMISLMPRNVLEYCVMRHAIQLCYCFGYDVTVRFIEMQMFQT